MDLTNYACEGRINQNYVIIQIFQNFFTIYYADYIPSALREANIYPIPKPKEWECDLNNTRPITLLETIRKAMVRLTFKREFPRYNKKKRIGLLHGIIKYIIQ